MSGLQVIPGFLTFALPTESLRAGPLGEGTQLKWAEWPAVGTEGGKARGKDPVEGPAQGSATGVGASEAERRASPWRRQVGQVPGVSLTLLRGPSLSPSSVMRLRKGTDVSVLFTLDF